MCALIEVLLKLNIVVGITVIHLQHCYNLFVFKCAFTEKLLQGNKKIKCSGGKELRLLRLYGRVHERSDFKGPYYGYLHESSKKDVCQRRFQPHALHHLIRKDCPELKEMEDKFKEMEKNEEVPTPKFFKAYNRLISKKEREIMEENYDVILATCNECAGRRLPHLSKRPEMSLEQEVDMQHYLNEESRIAQIIVDECGMAYEPETIAAISLCDRVVLIGDHKQLQPVIKYIPARDNGLGTSLFQRYAEGI